MFWVHWYAKRGPHCHLIIMLRENLLANWREWAFQAEASVHWHKDFLSSACRTFPSPPFRGRLQGSQNFQLQVFHCRPNCTVNLYLDWGITLRCLKDHPTIWLASNQLALVLLPLGFFFFFFCSLFLFSLLLFCKLKPRHHHRVLSEVLIRLVNGPRDCVQCLEASCCCISFLLRPTISLFLFHHSDPKAG